MISFLTKEACVASKMSSTSRRWWWLGEIVRVRLIGMVFSLEPGDGGAGSGFEDTSRGSRRRSDW